MSPLYHGITIRDAAMICGVPEANVRQWLSRGKLVRTTDGQICPLSLREWWDSRSIDQAKRGPEHTTRNNPYAAA
jgi:hypothetical protein